MDTAHEVTDSSDWLATTLPTFSQLENSLRCQVCKDFFTNPVITSCSHTFCSLCIRRCISSDGKCPACRTSDQASKLRQNWALEEVVATFKSARTDALKLATKRKHDEDDAAARPVKKRRTLNEDDPTSPSSQRQTRSRTKTQSSASSHVMVIDDDEGDDDYQDGTEAPDDGLVTCPICGGRMKEELVFSHTDTCNGTPPERKKSQTPVHALQRPPPRPPSQPQERIAELNYSMMTDTAMRKKLKDIGIPNTGPKPLMIRRHTEWANLWNSNCDSSRPKSKRELLHELDVWERSQGGQAKSSRAGVNGIMHKDFDAKAYSNSNKDDFDRLVQEARRKAKEKAKEMAKSQAIATQEQGNIITPAGQVTGLPNGHSAKSDPLAAPGRPACSRESNYDKTGANKATEHSADSGASTDGSAAPLPGTQNQALMSQAHPGVDAYSHERRVSDSLGARFNVQPTRKIPMLCMSSSAVADVEFSQEKM